MSLKWLGIIIPLVIIIILVFIGTLEIGISREKTTILSVPYNSLFPDKAISNNCDYNFLNKPENQVLLQTIKVRNNFVISRVEELPRYRACLYSSKTGSITGPYPPYIRYFVDGYSNWEYKSKDAFEVPAGSEKTLEVKIKPYCIKNKVKDYDYTEILLIEPEDGCICSKLTPEQINKAIRIKIEQ